MDDINDKIRDRFKVFDITVVWYLDSVKFYKLSFVLNNPNTLKNFVPSYKENLQCVRKIWNEFDWPSSYLGQDKKKKLKTIRYPMLIYWIY
jgi:hypothetical protein